MHFVNTASSMKATGRQIPEACFLEALDSAKEARYGSLQLQHAVQKEVAKVDAHQDSTTAVEWSFARSDIKNAHSQKQTYDLHIGNDGDNQFGQANDTGYNALHKKIYDMAVDMCRTQNRTKQQRAIAQTQFWADAQESVQDFLQKARNENKQCGTSQEKYVTVDATSISSALQGRSPSDTIHSTLQKAIRDVACGEHGDPVRPDGRSLDEVRPLDIELGILPNAHGSALFGKQLNGMSANSVCKSMQITLNINTVYYKNSQKFHCNRSWRHAGNMLRNCWPISRS